MLIIVLCLIAIGAITVLSAIFAKWYLDSEDREYINRERIQDEIDGIL